MSSANGHANGLEQRHVNAPAAVAPVAFLNALSPQFTPEQIRVLLAELEVPFDGSVIEWRVTNTTKDHQNPRGQILPYADQRAYTDRLNQLFSPTGWTRRYNIHTSANFQRAKDQKTVAKVFITCELTIHGIGSHSATGEEWADDENAGTSAEAQAFKRTCACFGLGRYLYYFTGVWVDLDQKKRPQANPKLAGWATPEGWRQGLRPPVAAASGNSSAKEKTGSGTRSPANGKTPSANRPELVRQIEVMQEPLGKGIYRGLLRTLARAWKPGQIEDPAMLQSVLNHMLSAERGLRRLDATVDKIGPAALNEILASLKLKSLDQVDTLNTLRKIVLSMEAKAGLTPHRS